MFRRGEVGGPNSHHNRQACSLSILPRCPWSGALHCLCVCVHGHRGWDPDPEVHQRTSLPLPTTGKELPHQGLRWLGLPCSLPTSEASYPGPSVSCPTPWSESLPASPSSLCLATRTSSDGLRGQQYSQQCAHLAEQQTETHTVRVGPKNGTGSGINRAWAGVLAL